MSSFLVAWPCGQDETEPKNNQLWEMGSVKESLLCMWHKPLEKFFSELHSFTASLQKGWGFPESCGGMGIGSEFHGMDLQELLLSLLSGALVCTCLA